MSSTSYWPPISHADLLQKTQEASRRELVWLLERVLQAPLQSTQDGLTECIALLDPQDGGSTLALSSTRSEAFKGFVVRMGEKIVKGEVIVKLGGLGNTKKGYQLSVSDEGIILTQVVDARNHIAAAMMLFDTPLTEHNALHNLTTLLAHISAARSSLRMPSSTLQFPRHVPNPTSFTPALPPNTSLDFTINEGLLQCDLRLLRPLTPKSTPLPSRVASHTSLFSLGKENPLFSKDTSLFSKAKDTSLFSMAKDAMFKKPEGIGGEIYTFDTKEVIVMEQVRVCSADPNFIAVLAKLAVLEERINNLRGKVEIVSLGVQKTY